MNKKQLKTTLTTAGVTASIALVGLGAPVLANADTQAAPATNPIQSAQQAPAALAQAQLNASDANSDASKDTPAPQAATDQTPAPAVQADAPAAQAQTDQAAPAQEAEQASNASAQQAPANFQASTMILAADPGDALLNQAWIQTGVLKQAMKGPSGHVYPAGTKVSRGSREQGQYQGQYGDVWYLSYDAAQFTLTGYGMVSNDYVQPTSEYHVNNLQNGDVWSSQSCVNSADAYGTLTPDGSAPAQTVDKGALQAEIGQAQGIDLSQYTDSSAQNVKSALATAENVNGNANASQSDVDNATDGLKTAVNGLVKKDIPSNVDKSGLEAEISKAKGFDLSQYTPTSADNLENALSAAESIDSNADATQDLVDSTTANLDNAINGLVKNSTPAQTVDTSALTSEINSAQSTIDAGGYTDASVANVKTAIAHGKSVLNNSASTQSDVDSATQTITDAVNGLVKAGTPAQTVDTSALKADIASAQSTIDAGGYTDASVANVKTAIENGKTVLGDKDATQADVDTAKKAIDTAVDGLVKADTPAQNVDKADLQATIQKAYGIDLSQYTKDSASVLSKVLKSAQAVFGDKDATQNNVDVADANLKAAIAGLVKADSGKDTPSNPSDNGGKDTPTNNGGQDKPATPSNNTPQNGNGQATPQPAQGAKTGTVTVQPGQTLSGIAGELGVPVGDLVKDNPWITDPNNLKAGDQLTVPAEVLHSPATDSTPAQDAILSKNDGTAADNKATDNKDAKKGTLPDTGQSETAGETALGIVATVAAGAVGLFEILKNKKNKKFNV